MSSLSNNLFNSHDDTCHQQMILDAKSARYHQRYIEWLNNYKNIKSYVSDQLQKVINATKDFFSNLWDYATETPAFVFVSDFFTDSPKTLSEETKSRLEKIITQLVLYEDQNDKQLLATLKKERSRLVTKELLQEIAEDVRQKGLAIEKSLIDSYVTEKGTLDEQVKRKGIPLSERRIEGVKIKIEEKMRFGASLEKIEKGFALCPELKETILKTHALVVLNNAPQAPLNIRPDRDYNGINGAFFLKKVTNQTNEHAVSPEILKTIPNDDLQTEREAVFKPAHLEAYDAGGRIGLPGGSGAMRERIAYVVSQELKKQTGLDFGIPETTMMSFSTANGMGGTTTSFGSLQKYIPNCIPLNQALREGLIDKLPKEEIYKLLIDVALLNSDRHLGNALYDQKNNKLILIDHGYCLPKAEGAHQGRLLWAKKSFADIKLCDEWRTALCAITPSTIVKAVQEDLKKHKDLFGEEASKYLKYNEEILSILRIGLCFLKAGALEDLHLFEFANNVNHRNWVGGNGRLNYFVQTHVKGCSYDAVDWNTVEAEIIRMSRLRGSSINAATNMNHSASLI